MEADAFITKQANGIATVTLNRPERHNAFNNELIALLINFLQELEKDPDVKIIVLTASGKNFSAGADLEWMKKMALFTPDENYHDALQLVNLLKTLSQISKPTIALAQGNTMGGGVGLLACCDIVIAAHSAKFCFSEAKLGLVPATIAPYVIKAMGSRAARYYFLTAKIFNADVAQRINLVHEIVEDNELSSVGLDLANNLLKNGPKALTIIKQLIEKFDATNEKILHETAKLIADVRASQEAQEGLSAFFEKRTPQW